MALERWERSGSYVTLSGAFDARLGGDRVSAQVHSTVSPRLDASGWFGRAGALLAWRSSDSARAPVVTTRMGIETTGGSAPYNVWPRAGLTGDSQALTRAHSGWVDGAAGSGLFGRRLAYASAELEVPVVDLAASHLSLAVFGDAARAWELLDRRASLHSQVDVGIGMLLRTARTGPALRVDIAQGLRDGARAVSLRWQLPWPGVDH
jgi:hypothetical protein